MATKTTDSAEYNDATEWPSWCDEGRWVPTDPDAPGEWDYAADEEPDPAEVAQGFRELDAAIAGGKQLEEQWLRWRARCGVGPGPDELDRAWLRDEIDHLEAQRPACEGLPITLAGLDGRIDHARRRLEMITSDLAVAVGSTQCEYPPRD
jgi:hypothetical protein